jgi:hypothetical protein
MADILDAHPMLECRGNIYNLWLHILKSNIKGGNGEDSRGQGVFTGPRAAAGFHGIKKSAD